MAPQLPPPLPTSTANQKSEKFSLPSLEALAVPVGVGYQVGKAVSARFGALPGVLSGLAAVALTGALLTQVDETRALKLLEKTGIKLSVPVLEKA
jgi:hypothetical protein